MNFLTTSEFAKRVGVTPQQIVVLLKKKDLNPARYENGQARFTDAQIPLAKELLTKPRKKNKTKPTDGNNDELIDPPSIDDTPPIACDLPLATDARNEITPAQINPPQNDTPQPTTEERIAEAESFFNLLYGSVTARKFSYLWTLPDRRTYPFDVSTPENRHVVAQKAIELCDSGKEVFFGVNLTDNPCKEYQRPKGERPKTEKDLKEAAEKGWELVTTQVARIADIDVEGGKHISDEKVQYPPTFGVAKSFLPFEFSLVINSGYGLHGYAILDAPLDITDENRKEAVAQNTKLLEVIRARAGKFADAVDAVQDLPRILRVPGTRNYKLGFSENAPLVKIVDDAGLRFKTADLDEKITSLLPPVEEKPLVKPARTEYEKEPEYEAYRVRRMIDCVPIANLHGVDWLAAMTALKVTGMTYSEFDALNVGGENYNEAENRRRWDSITPTGDWLGALYNLATQYGYDEKNVRAEFYQMHPELKPRKSKDKTKSTQDEIEAALAEARKELAEFEARKTAAIERIRNLDAFDSKTIKSNLEAAAFAKIYDPNAYDDLYEAAKNYGSDPKARVNLTDFKSKVNGNVKELEAHRADLTTRINRLEAQLATLKFSTKSKIPILALADYKVTPTDGIQKIVGEKLIEVAPYPIAILSQVKEYDSGDVKFKLAQMTNTGYWQTLGIFDAESISDSRAIIKLSRKGLRVTSSTASHIVDYFHAARTFLEPEMPMTYEMPRCGWYRLGGQNLFVDPRRHCEFKDEEGKIINVEVSAKSQFAQCLKTAGSLEKWREAYELAKKSPIARFMVAAAVAPPLLKVLNARNFLVFLYGDSLGGKSTSLELAASAIGTDLMRSFDATKNGILAAAADVNDYALFIDEKQSADTKLKEAFDTLVYALANGVGRSRASKDGSAKKVQDWRTIALMTGEEELLDKRVMAGANNRLYVIKVPKHSAVLPPRDCGKIRLIVKDNFGHVLPLVTDRIQYSKEIWLEFYEDIQKVLRELYPEYPDEHLRYTAVVTIADHILNDVIYGEDDAHLSEAVNMAAAILPLIPTSADLDKTQDAIEFLRDYIARYSNQFLQNRRTDAYIRDICGSIEDDFIYVARGKLKETCEAVGINYSKLVDTLFDAGFFKPSDKPQRGRTKPDRTVNPKLNGVPTRCYRIPREVLKDE